MSKPLFIRSTAHPMGRKVECRICHHCGDDTKGEGWQAHCLRGHAPCPTCGHINPLKLNGTARKCTAKGAVERHAVVRAR